MTRSQRRLKNWTVLTHERLPSRAQSLCLYRCRGNAVGDEVFAESCADRFGAVQAFLGGKLVEASQEVGTKTHLNLDALANLRSPALFWYQFC